jgi:alpha-tubulin suppressor-like RCC1 family protein
MLRDPIARSYSAYDYVLRESNKPIHPLYKANSLESLLKTKRFYNDIGLGANAYTRVLSDFLPDQAEACERRYKKHQGQWSDRLEGREYWDCRMDIAKRVLSQHMDLVCVTERYRDCIDVAATELFPTWFPKNYGRIPVRNAAPKPHRSKNSRVDALLRQANQQDLELYQYAWHLFECRWQQYTLRREKQAQLVAWGNNRHGQLGVAQPAWIYRLINVTLLETRTDAVPVQIGGGGGIWDWTAKNQRVCGAYSLVLTSRGTLFSAGWNRWALLGRQGKRGMQDDSPMFAPISFVDPATTTTTTTNNFSATVLQFSAGHRHALAVVAMVDRRELSNVLLYVYAWGMNGYGQLGTGTVGSSRPQRVRGLPDAKTDPVVRVAAGGRHSLALTRSGQVWAWGLNQGNLLFLDRTKTKRSSHGDHVYAPERVEPLRQVHVAEICAGTRHSMALDRQGGIWEWGWSAECPKDQMRLCKRAEFRKVELPLDASQPIDVVCAGGGSFALDAQGQLYAWGTNAVAELGLGHPNQVGEYVMDPIRVEGLPPLQRVWSSYDYVPGFHGGMTLALSRRGHPRLWAWGPLGPGVHASRIDVGTSAQRFDEKDARKWCQEHHDGHLGNQLERCALQLWRYIATNPVQLHQHLSSKDCLWTTAGVVNRGSVLYSVCAPLFGINTS